MNLTRRIEKLFDLQTPEEIKATIDKIVSDVDDNREAYAKEKAWGIWQRLDEEWMQDCGEVYGETKINALPENRIKYFEKVWEETKAK